MGQACAEHIPAQMQRMLHVCNKSTPPLPPPHLLLALLQRAAQRRQPVSSTSHQVLAGGIQQLHTRLGSALQSQGQAVQGSPQEVIQHLADVRDGHQLLQLSGSGLWWRQQGVGPVGNGGGRDGGFGQVEREPGCDGRVAGRSYDMCM